MRISINPYVPYPLELLPPQSDFQGKKIFEEKF